MKDVFVDPERVLRDIFAAEPPLETFMAAVLVHRVCAMYPHLRKSEIPQVQLTHLIFLLLDYLEADPEQPEPVVNEEK